ncbi:MAG: translation initiation factor IF-2, partial [Mycoplasmataceae bacterium]|nr:translation initiation factor IF-2 [Mycoplasmataceae bacterium]
MSKNRKTSESQILEQMKIVDVELKDGVFVYTGPLSIAEFCKTANLKLNEVVGYFFKKGEMFNANHTLTEDQLVELCLEYEFDFQKESEVNASNFMDEVEISDHDDDLIERSPIITIMGHVDHGKTTLIDKIRNANVAGSEAGGITQHTGAYQIERKGKKITFLDTPGHEAFTSMRSRGAQLTDIVILVVAADDGIMPQTKEAIDHAKAAKVPVIVFVNKMDKPGADLERVKGDLSKYDIVAEDWGGDHQILSGSALKGEGIEKLFDAIFMEAEMLELKANPNRQALGIVVESRLDKGMGSTSTVIVTNGTLLKKDFIVAGSNYGRIRTLRDTDGKDINEVMPGSPAVITGLNQVPNPGDKFYGFVNEKLAKELASEKAFEDKQKSLKQKAAIQIEDGVKVMNIIIKSDVQGTAEAVKHTLAAIENEETKVNIVRASVGLISKNDILLAQASNAIIFSFNIKPKGDVSAFAKQEKVEIKTYSIIYKMIEEVERMLKGMMAPK